MLQIYQKAAQVIVWLGDQQQYNRTAVRYLDWLANRYPRSWLQPSYVDFHSAYCHLGMLSVCSGLTDLCNRDWIRRIWIKQEVWANRNVVVMCGDTQFTWQAFQYCSDVKLLLGIILEANEEGYVLRWQTSGPHGASISESQLRALRGLQIANGEGIQAHTWDKSDAPHEIVDLLNSSSESKSLEESDRIYAVLGMANIPTEAAATPGQNQNPAFVPIGYNRGYHQVCQDLSRYLMYHLGVYAVLNTEGAFGSRDGINLPSWCPDFRQPIDPMVSGRSEPGDAVWEYSHPSRLQKHRELGINYDSNTLAVRGYVIATLSVDLQSTVEELHPIPSGFSDFEESLKLMDCDILSHMARSWHQVRNPHTPDPVFRDLMGGLRHYVQAQGGFAVPEEARRGDLIVMVFSSRLPLVMRRSTANDMYSFVGCAWLNPSAEHHIQAWVNLDRLLDDDTSIDRWPADVLHLE
ncbi:uncharacterized protein LTR77_000938 [Saxophila tyrrhenica]|uniref:Heterokaryon incompatibility domain-containing protein n=1 Tax=Saxophila tyrrhenica TaxID=1690608 RepID=A0AAV9PTY3_9PEZI|nr:hypothetical protein LTR77_000938 [Saxophila tyrrhenica]